MARAYIGLSGWNYQSWKNDFYEGVPASRWLEHSASTFNALEVNGTFYRAQPEATYEKWSQRTPDGFVFAAKAHRFATHSKRLNDPEATVPRIADNMRALEPKLRAVLWQLPASARADVERLRTFCSVAPKGWPSVRHVIEFRHPSWFGDDIADVLREHDVASCISDAADWPMWDVVTTDLVYVRLHGHTRTYASAYHASSIDAWARRVSRWLAEGRDVHVYFDNDQEGAAPRDALRLVEAVAAI